MSQAVLDLESEARKHGLAVGPDKWHPAFLRRLRFPVRTLLDVGVARGTPELYAAYPDAHVVMFEPRDIRAVVAEYQKALPSVEYHAVALGAEEGTATLQVPHGQGALASLYDRTPLTDRPELARQELEVPVRRLDDLRATGTWDPPYGLKIDTEGFELEVLRGAVETLASTKFVIAEGSVKRRFEGSYEFHELVAFMAEHGFALLDVLNGHRGSPRFLDCLFVPAEDPRRSLDLRDFGSQG